MNKRLMTAVLSLGLAQAVTGTSAFSSGRGWIMEDGRNEARPQLVSPFAGDLKIAKTANVTISGNARDFEFSKKILTAALKTLRRSQSGTEYKLFSTSQYESKLTASQMSIK